MQTGRSTIKDIFDGTRIFNVPIYQRSYSWREENLEDFFNDIFNQPSKQDYFLGSFLFHLNGSRDDFKIVDIVDGQQRLTTFILFINELLEILISKQSTKVSKRTKRIFIKDEDVYKLELSNEDSSFLHNSILSNSSNKELSANTPSQSLLLNAKRYFKSKLYDSELDLIKLEELYSKAIKSEVLLYVVEEMKTATQIFELLNDRGRKLSDLESIKSFLMYNISLVSNNPNQIINNIQLEFAEIYRLIESNKLNENDLLRYHTIAFENSYEKPKKFIKEKIIKLIHENKKDIAKKVIQDYAVGLHRSFKVFSEITSNSDTLYSNFNMIGRVASFYPLLMNIKHNRPERYSELVKNINKFTIRASLASLRSNGESHFIKSMWQDEDAINLIANFSDHNWWGINDRAKQAINNKNHYEWLNKNILRYILFQYENHLRKGKYSLLTVDDYFKTTEKGARILNIEHITAKKVKDLELDQEFKEEYLNNIGNLVIDYLVPNIQNGNKNTEDKITEYSTAPIMSKHKISIQNVNWKDLSEVKLFIENREKELREFISNEFGLKIKADNKVQNVHSR